MAKRNQYTDEFRAGAVVMLESQGYPGTPGALLAVSRHLNVPSRTLSRWFRREQNPAPDKLVTLKKGDLSALLRDEAYAILGAMDGERTEANYRELGTVLGIVIDKLQLLDGKPTERSEQKVSHDVSDDLREAILSKIARVAQTSSAPDDH